VTTYSPQVRIPYNDLSFEVVGSAARPGIGAEAP